jgi:2-amino-4-hydroxy-6-hydroxymethyldihydropteridine diphosphokinase
VAELAFVALGSNLGDRCAALAAARGALSLVDDTALAAVSSVEETAPLGGLPQGPYLNQMVALRTALGPFALLSALQRVEASLGRVRAVRWASRTIDLDIVEYGDRIESTPTLVLPHPGRANRAFWQRELAELRTLVGPRP